MLLENTWIRCVVMEDLKKSIEEMIKEELIKVVISNKLDKDVKYNKITFLLKENKKEKYEHNTCYGNIYAQRIIFFFNFFFLYF